MKNYVIVNDITDDNVIESGRKVKEVIKRANELALSTNKDLMVCEQKEGKRGVSRWQVYTARLDDLIY